MVGVQNRELGFTEFEATPGQVACQVPPVDKWGRSFRSSRAACRLARSMLTAPRVTRTLPAGSSCRFLPRLSNPRPPPVPPPGARGVKAAVGFMCGTG